jgi:AcrR family transcriptional regulator
MPKIFSDAKRQEIRDLLLDTGLELVRQYGVKKLSIEELTKRVGIAQGTFYNFFPSKEVLILAIAQRHQAGVDACVSRIVESKGFLGRDDLRALYDELMLRDEDNIFRYLTREDVQQLATRLPKEYSPEIPDARTEIERKLRFVRGAKDGIDISAVINWIQLMNLAIQNQDLLLKPGLDKLIRGLIDNMLDEIFI